MVKGSSIILANLTLSQLWQRSLVPSLPLLADICQLSIGSVRQALPELLAALQYQLVALHSTFVSQTPQNTAKNMPKSANRTLFIDWMGQVQRYDGLMMGVNFASLHANQSALEPVMALVFPDSEQRYAVLGVLLTKVKLTLPQLHQLFGWVVLLGMIVLWRFLQAVQSQIDTSVIDRWLTAHPILTLNDSMTANTSQHINESLMMLAGLPYIPPSQRLKQYQQWQREIVTYPNGELAWLNQLQTTIDAFLASRPLAIVPYDPKVRAATHTVKGQNSLTAIPKVASVNAVIGEANPLINSDVFQPVARPTFADYLQKHWIATAGVLSLLIFGGLGWAFNRQNSTGLLKTPADITASKVQPDDSPKYQDVAIVRVASTTEPSVASVASTTDAQSVQTASTASGVSKTIKTTATTDKNAKATDDKKLDKTPNTDNSKKAKKADDKADSKKTDSTKTDTKKSTEKNTAKNKDKAKSDKTVKSATSSKQLSKASDKTDKDAKTKTAKASEKTSAKSSTNKDKKDKTTDKADNDNKKATD